MSKERFLKITNLMSDDEAANTAYYTRDNFLHKLVLMTTDGIAIVSLIFNGELTDINELEANSVTDVIEIGFGVAVDLGRERAIVTFDEDGNIESKSIDFDISVDSVYQAGDMEELDEMVENGDVDESIYGILDELHVMIG